MSYLRYLCLFAHSDVQHILCCVFVFVLFFLVLCTLCCPLLIAPSVFSKVYWLNVTEYLCYKWSRMCCYGISVLQMTTDLLLRNICVINDYGCVVTEYLCYKWTRMCCYGISVLQMTMDLLLCNICFTNDHGFVPFLRSCLHSWLITGFTTKVTRWMPLMYQELFTLQEHLCSRQAFSRVRK